MTGVYTGKPEERCVMAIRKPRPVSAQPTGEDAQPAVSSYSVLRRKLTVQSDGSIRIPVQFARMLADPGEEVTATFFSDGHIEVVGEAGRIPTPASPGVSRVHQNTEEFIAALESASARS
jgi:hypothetical protein